MATMAATILAIFDPQVLLPTKFRVNWPFGSGEDAKIDFQDGHHGGHFGFPIRTILAIFDLQVIQMLPTKFRVNWPRGVGGGHLLTTIAHLEHFMLRWANNTRGPIVLNRSPECWGFF